VRAGASIILPWVCAGCVTTVAAQRPLSSEKTEEINELVAGKTADLGLEGAPQVITGKDTRIEGDSLRFLKQDATSTEWVPAVEPVASARRIEVTRRGRGALIGLGIGLPIGLAGGALAGSLVADSLCGACVGDGPGRALYVLVGTAIGGFSFGLLGAVVGALIGSPAKVEFSDNPSR